MLYQLSYASPDHRRTASGKPETVPPNALDTLPLSTLGGTKIKVSIQREAEQTGGPVNSAQGTVIREQENRALGFAYKYT